MKASDVMVRDVITIGPNDDVIEAAALLVDHDISALPVIDNERKVIGILSEADLIRREELGTEKRRAWWLETVLPAGRLASDYAKSHGRKVAEIMSQDVITATADASLAEIATLLERNRIKRVPIVEDGRLIGVVSRSNLIQALASAPASAPTDIQADRALRLEVLARLRDRPWTGFGERNILVTNSVVHVWGLVGSPEEHKALLALSESVPGVRSVVDEMIPSYT